tara:strand:+ start:6883 stop:7458 length:576 start_codon:yes stop_codon:yes gene_type:complete
MAHPLNTLTEAELQEEFNEIKNDFKADKIPNQASISTHINHKSDLELISIDGRTPDEWDAHLRINIPNEPSTVMCNEALVKTNERLQIAYSYLIKAELTEQNSEWIKKSKYRESVANIVDEHKKKGVKTPAASTVETLAENKTKDSSTVYLASKARTMFWRRHVESLKATANILNNMSWNLRVESTIIKGI